VVCAPFSLLFVSPLSRRDGGYYDYLYTVDSYNNEVIKNKIIEICGINDEERREFGMRAKEYVLNEKNSMTQAKKIRNFLNEVLL